MRDFCGSLALSGCLRPLELTSRDLPQMREYFEAVKGVRPDDPLSADVQRHAGEVLGAPVATLTAVGAQLVRLAAAAARDLDDSMSICYWWQVCADADLVLTPKTVQNMSCVLLLSSLQHWPEASNFERLPFVLDRSLTVFKPGLASCCQTLSCRRDGPRRCNYQV